MRSPSIGANFVNAMPPNGELVEALFPDQARLFGGGDLPAFRHRPGSCAAVSISVMQTASAPVYPPCRILSGEAAMAYGVTAP